MGCFESVFFAVPQVTQPPVGGGNGLLDGHPLHVARRFLASPYITGSTEFWERCHRQWVASIPTIDDEIREKLVSAVNAGTKHISAAERQTVANELVAFLEHFEFVGIEPPDQHSGEAAGTIIASPPPVTRLPAYNPELFEVPDEFVKFSRYDLFRLIAGTKLITSPHSYWTRGLRMRLWTVLPAHLSSEDKRRLFVSMDDKEYQDLRSKMFHPVSPEATPITKAERDTVNAFLKQFVETYQSFKEECSYLEIHEDHDLGVDFIFEVPTSDERVKERIGMCRLINSLYMRKSNAYWPRQLKEWTAALCEESGGVKFDQSAWYAAKLQDVSAALGPNGPKYLSMEQKDVLFRVLKHRIKVLRGSGA